MVYSWPSVQGGPGSRRRSKYAHGCTQWVHLLLLRFGRGARLCVVGSAHSVALQASPKVVETVAMEEEEAVDLLAGRRQVAS